MIFCIRFHSFWILYIWNELWYIEYDILNMIYWRTDQIRKFPSSYYASFIIIISASNNHKFNELRELIRGINSALDKQYTTYNT